MSDEKRPTKVIFFHNGLAAVFDQHGHQMGEFQQGDHDETIRLLNAAGYPWHTLDVTGQPIRGTLGRPYDES